VLTAGKHGSTFGGNPLACRAALAVLDTLRQQNLVARAAQLGNKILDGFRTAFSGNPHVVEVRGRGLMMGIELDTTCTDLTSSALDQGLLINVTADRTIRLLPPLILSDDEAQHLINGVVRLVNDFTAH
jgi:acetylornithine aminotransferase